MGKRWMPIHTDIKENKSLTPLTSNQISAVEVSRQNENVPIYGPMVSKFDVVRYLLMQLPEQFHHDATIQKLTDDSLLAALNHEDGHTKQEPIVNQSTYEELYQANKPYSLVNLVDLNFDNDAPDWKVAFETAKGTEYCVEKYNSELRLAIATAKERTLMRTCVGSHESYVTTIREHFNEKGQVVSRDCDVNRYDEEGNQLPVSNRFDEIRYSLIAAEWEQNPERALDYYEMIDPEHQFKDRYSFLEAIPMDSFYERFQKLVLPAGSYLDLSHPDSRLLDNIVRFMVFTHKIEDQLGKEGEVLLSEALLEPISTHFGVVDATPFQADGLAIVKNPNHQYTMVTLNVACEKGKYTVSSFKQDASIDDVVRALSRNSKNTQLDGITEFTDGHKLNPAFELKIAPVSQVAYREPLLPNATDF